jgi:iron complex transport system ATP-binding protein
MSGALPPKAGDVSAGDTILRVNGVHFAYDDHHVLKDIGLSVKRGTCTCLIGVNACGKSTLIDCILGVLHPSAGEVSIDGEQVRHLKPAKLARKVAYVPQIHERSFPYLVDHMVLMGRSAHSRLLSPPGRDDREFAQHAIEECGIAHLAKRPCTTLSGGEMQMVLLARALAQDAPLILMDEPTAHLDFKNELLFLETIESLITKRGVTVLMATHAPNQAFHLAQAGVSTRVAVMNGGSIWKEGPPREVLSEHMLRTVFGIEAHLLECDPPPGGTRPIRQIVPRRTLRSEESAE